MMLGADAGDHGAEHHRHEDDARVGRRLALHALDEERQEHDGAEHRRRLQHAGQRRDAEDAVLEEAWIDDRFGGAQLLSLIHISEPTRLGMISYAVFCLKKKKKKKKK